MGLSQGPSKTSALSRAAPSESERLMRYRDDDDDEWESDSYDDADDDLSDSEPTRDCPSCGFEMLEICDQCPSCGQWLSREDSRSPSQPRWVIIGALLCLATLLFFLLLQF